MKKIHLITIGVLTAVCAFAISSQAQKSAPRCTGQQVKVTEGGEGADMGGKRYDGFIFENVSKHPCTVRGFPRLIAFDRRGRNLSDFKVEYSNNYPGAQDATTKTVTLDAG